MTDHQFNLRPAILEDEDEIFALFAIVHSLHADARPAFFRPAKQDDLWKDDFKAATDSDRAHIIVAERDGGIAGYIRSTIFKTQEAIYTQPLKFASISQIAVQERFRRTGCASALLDHVQAQAKDLGLSFVSLEHWWFNEPALKTFSNHGFVPQRQTMWLEIDAEG